MTKFIITTCDFDPKEYESGKWKKVTADQIARLFTIHFPAEEFGIIMIDEQKGS